MTNISHISPALLDYDRDEPGTKHHILSWSLVIMMMLAIFGNSMLFVSVYRKPALRTRTNMFILNLACADLGVALLCMPFSIVTCSRQAWIFGEALCQFNGFINILFAMASLLTLTAISVEKYFAIVKPLYRVITNQRALLMLVFTWLGASAFAVMPLTGFTRYEFKIGTTQCSVKSPATTSQTIHAFIVFSFAYLVPLSIMGFAYVKIFKAARNHNRRLSRVSISSGNCTPSSAQRQIAFTVFIMLVVCLLCWTPYFIYVIFLTSDPKALYRTAVRELGIAAYWCAFLNSTLDPYIYGLRNPQFKAAFKDVFTSFARGIYNCCADETDSDATESRNKASWEFSSSDSDVSPVSLSERDDGKARAPSIRYFSETESISSPTSKDARVWFSDDLTSIPNIKFYDDVIYYNPDTETVLELPGKSRVHWESYQDCEYSRGHAFTGHDVLKANHEKWREKGVSPFGTSGDVSPCDNSSALPSLRETTYAKEEAHYYNAGRKRRYGVQQSHSFILNLKTTALSTANTEADMSSHTGVVAPAILHCTVEKDDVRAWQGIQLSTESDEMRDTCVCERDCCSCIEPGSTTFDADTLDQQDQSTIASSSSSTYSKWDLLGHSHAKYIYENNVNMRNSQECNILRQGGFHYNIQASSTVDPPVNKNEHLMKRRSTSSLSTIVTLKRKARNSKKTIREMRKRCLDEDSSAQQVTCLSHVSVDIKGARPARAPRYVKRNGKTETKTPWIESNL